MNKDQWWFPVLIDEDHIAQLRQDYPEHAGKTDEELIDYFDNHQKYSTTWDHVGDAYEEYEPLADSYLEALKHISGMKSAMFELLGCHNLVDLNNMEAVVRATPGINADKIAVINGIFALRELIRWEQKYDENN